MKMILLETASFLKSHRVQYKAAAPHENMRRKLVINTPQPIAEHVTLLWGRGGVKV